MVVSIIMIALALAWLMTETDFMRVRLESTEYQRAVKAQSESQGKVKDMPEETVSLYQPSQFMTLDMPATTGELNIVCQRG